MLRLEDWRVEPRADGVRCSTPDDRCELFVTERQAPRVPLATLVDAGMAQLDVRFATRSETLELETDEGEWGRMISISGSRADRSSLDWTLAIVEAEDFYLRIDGLAYCRTRAELVRQSVTDLAQRVELGLGALRRRHFRLDPPAGWTPAARGSSACWQRGDALIAAFRARPRDGLEQGRASFRLLEAARFREPGPPDGVVPIGSRHRLAGTLELTRVEGRAVDTATFTDDRFAYVLRLESGACSVESDRLAFASVLDSVRPLPRPRRPTLTGPVEIPATLALSAYGG